MDAARKCAPLIESAKTGNIESLAQIELIINALRAADTASRPSINERKPRQGRVKNLTKVREGWQETVYENLSEKWKTAFAVMALTGCRPGELNGLQIRPTDKASILNFRIMGEKVNEKSGQEWRILEIDVRDAVGADTLIAEIGKDGGELEIVETPQAITKAITRAAQRAKLIRLDQTLPAYVCRNAVASRMKADGYSVLEVAAALGHSSDECQKFYGRANAGHKGGGGKVLSIKTARPVRETGYAQKYEPDGDVKKRGFGI